MALCITNITCPYCGHYPTLIVDFMGYRGMRHIIGFEESGYVDMKVEIKCPRSELNVTHTAIHNLKERLAYVTDKINYSIENESFDGLKDAVEVGVGDPKFIEQLMSTELYHLAAEYDRRLNDGDAGEETVSRKWLVNDLLEQAKRKSGE